MSPPANAIATQPQIMIRKIQSGSLSVFWKFFIHFQFGTLFLGEIFYLYTSSIITKHCPAVMILYCLPGGSKASSEPPKGSKKERSAARGSAACQPYLCLMGDALHPALSWGHHCCPESWAGLCLNCPC